MRTRSWMLLLALILPLAGCGRGEAPKEKEEAGHEEAGAEEGHGEEHAETAEHAETEQEGVLAIDPEVLRDLKLTTFPAELRPGGEGVTALGELKVNEGAYAEVGVPIAARVARLIASPGQAVRRGQPLAELQSVELGQARAEHTAARARAELARQTVERKRGLAAERIVSRGELQRSEAEAAEAEADLQAAEASLAALGVGVRAGGGDLSRFSLLSPLSGTVLERTRRAPCSASPTCRASGWWCSRRSATRRGCGRARPSRSPWPPCRARSSGGRWTGWAGRWTPTPGPCPSASSCPTRTDA
jgi:cobalt-zinc-cadmium efflux system membrane fusion protein